MGVSSFCLPPKKKHCWFPRVPLETHKKTKCHPKNRHGFSFCGFPLIIRPRKTRVPPNKRRSQMVPARLSERRKQNKNKNAARRWRSSNSQAACGVCCWTTRCRRRRPGVGGACGRGVSERGLGQQASRAPSEVCVAQGFGGPDLVMAKNLVRPTSPEFWTVGTCLGVWSKC